MAGHRQPGHYREQCPVGTHARWTGAVLTGVGDGSVRVRCQCGPVLSDLEVEVRGLGSLYLDPYGYVSAALFNDSHGEIGNGNERGIATSRTDMSWVAYTQLDFGTRGFTGIAIRGKSKLENNTIHLRFEGEDGQQRRVVEFPGSDSWAEVTFPLEPVYGRQDVTFLFLPGCDFDFMEFLFL